jgi:hypothetical protein
MDAISIPADPAAHLAAAPTLSQRMRAFDGAEALGLTAFELVALARQRMAVISASEAVEDAAQNVAAAVFERPRAFAGRDSVVRAAIALSVKRGNGGSGAAGLGGVGDNLDGDRSPDRSPIEHVNRQTRHRLHFDDNDRSDHALKDDTGTDTGTGPGSGTDTVTGPGSGSGNDRRFQRGLGSPAPHQHQSPSKSKHAPIAGGKAPKRGAKGQVSDRKSAENASANPFVVGPSLGLRPRTRRK